ncbi:serine--tRNA synthetase-like protein Slimp [Penaeus indicus]|uniref:serine--tRNA synthetase-like protein Slimp n=1 Tax=Penaeus indicus TaxID=29960 RepID=UPI00300CB7B6
MAVQMIISVNNLKHITHTLRNVAVPLCNRAASFSSHAKEATVKKQSTSALYVSGNKATTTFSVLSPYLDFTKCFQDIGRLEANVKLRGFDTDVRELSRMWTELKEKESEKEKLEKERTSVAKLMKECAKMKDKNVKEMQELKRQGKDIREQLKSITQEIWDLEEKAVIGALQLPNVLHKSTGEYEKELFKLFEKPKYDFQARSHVELGRINQELEFINVSPSAYYLKGRLAALELACNDYFLTNFKNHGYLIHSNPDFAKAVIVEGCGVNIDERVFALGSHESDTDSNLQYLVGGGSLQAFAAYFTKQVISNPECLPQKLITVGRHYAPPRVHNPSLLHAGQSTVVDAFLLYHSQAIDEELLLNEVLMALVQSYSRLNLHFRLTQYSAQRLEPQESAAIGLEMFSPHTEDYHEVSRISLYGDFISKRLWSLHKTGPSSANFLSMIHVKVCHMSRLLALIMENGQKEDGCYQIPTCITTCVDEL